MGPAYLADVIGLDTMSHIIDVICAGYPQRMTTSALEPTKVMAARQRYGQKSGVGFYRYETDPNGRRKKVPEPDTYSLLAPSQKNGTRDFSDAEIVERMMLPMVLEAAVALEEGVVESATALDTAMSLGLGFPKSAGGPLQYTDQLGLGTVVRAERPLRSPRRALSRQRRAAAPGLLVLSWHGDAQAAQRLSQRLEVAFVATPPAGG